MLDELDFVSHVPGCASHIVIDVSAGKDHTSLNGTDRREAPKQSRFSEGFGRLGRAGHAANFGRPKSQIAWSRHDGNHVPKSVIGVTRYEGASPV